MAVLKSTPVFAVQGEFTGKSSTRQRPAAVGREKFFAMSRGRRAAGHELHKICCCFDPS